MLLQKRTEGLDFICTCLQRTRCGTCVHVLILAWLDGDATIRFSELSEQTKRTRPDSTDNGENALRMKKAGRSAELPPKSAWITTQCLKHRAEAKAAERKRKRDHTQTTFRNFFVAACLLSVQTPSMVRTAQKVGVRVHTTPVSM